VRTLKKSANAKRTGGSGVYQVVRCGTAGHNIRSKPGVKGTPVGRLTKGNKLEVSDEVRRYLGLQLCSIRKLQNVLDR